MAKHQLGVQLYTLRGFCKDINGIRDTFQKVAKIGYKTVQLSGLGPADPKDIAKALEDNGLEAVSTHTGWDKFLNDIDKTIEDLKLWKCSHPAIPGLPADKYLSEDGIKKFRDEMGPVAEKLAKAGMDLSYHNHSRELVRIGKKPWLEMFYEQVPANMIKAELDLYWVTHGGGDPIQWIKRYPGRQPVIHFKDMKVTAKQEQLFAEIGEGNLNWAGILKACQESGVGYYLIEQDNCYERDPFESVAISYRNLSAMGLS